MNKKRTSRPRRKAPRSRPDAQMRPAPQTPPPADTQTNPADNPPTKRKLPGWVHKPDSDSTTHGSLLHLRADFLWSREAVRIRLELEHYRLLEIIADHAQTRAAITSLRHSLDEFARFTRDDHGDACADFPKCAQVKCYRRVELGREDEELRFRLLPGRDLIRLYAHFSEGDGAYSAWVYLTRTEAEALLHDLERALVDLERYGDIGR